MSALAQRLVLVMSVQNAVVMPTVCWLAYKFDRATLGNINILAAIIVSCVLCLLPIYIYLEARQFDEFIDEVIKGHYERSNGGAGRFFAHFGWMTMLLGNALMIKQIVTELPI